MIGSTVGPLFDTGQIVAQSLEDNTLIGDGPPSYLLTNLPLVVTNVVATLLIAYKAWIHYRQIVLNLKSTGSTPSKVHKILLLLVESGAIYCVIMIAYMVITALPNIDLEVYEMASTVIPSIAGIYPVLIILIAHFEKDESCGSSKSISTLEFAEHGIPSHSTSFSSSSIPSSMGSRISGGIRTKDNLELHIMDNQTEFQFGTQSNA
ncbi:hypothetical protein K435DRAFT_782939 [Dendrothele bispora CBS 962.96]|uniref:Uncharacterized protein n=1 Tax=Dendrothele bispora (strain CBS 962.96) TaxID=1314807 RepID=A0A4S8LBV4_DENBC|nr:hypothetical protein K435DRAFT_782939 [Dendrothele bispora CBS 962.96]